jgi:hypothetical protein
VLGKPTIVNLHDGNPVQYVLVVQLQQLHVPQRLLFQQPLNFQQRPQLQQPHHFQLRHHYQVSGQCRMRRFIVINIPFGNPTFRLKDMNMHYVTMNRSKHELCYF